MTTRIHAFCDDALGDLDATGVAARIRSGEISSLEAVEAAIARARRVDPQLGAIQFTGYEMARRQAREPAMGFFQGVPSFLKDNTRLAGLPTNHGTQAFVGLPSGESDPFALHFQAEGFVCLGKSRLPEFGFNASTEFMDLPPTRNPWHPDYSPGASSGGAAALVAAGVVPIAHANDGGGSIRIPAACCGLVGLKPSRGRLPSPEMSKALPIDLAVDGVVSRSVRDTANFYAEFEHLYRSALPAIGRVEGPATRRLRIGVAYDSITGGTDTETRAAVEHTVKLLEGLGHHVSEIALPVPPSFAEDFGIYWGMMSFMVSNLGKFIMNPEFNASRLDNLSKGLSRLYRRNLLRTPAVLRRLRDIPRIYGGMFAHCDAILSPVLAHTVPELGHLSPAQDFESLFERLRNYVSFTPFNNIAGGPGISLPLAATVTGLPLGLHFSAATGNERILLELAFELEAAKPWRRINQTG